MYIQLEQIITFITGVGIRNIQACKRVAAPDYVIQILIKHVSNSECVSTPHCKFCSKFYVHGSVHRSTSIDH
jgi:hypothetical protein